jgi:hypothetical protein
VTADVEAVAAAAQGCPLVAGLTGGRFGEIATYRPGRRILGVREADGARATVAPYAGGLPISVFIEDIELPGTASPAELTEASVGSP